MAVFLTGGNGKVTRRIAERLSGIKQPVIRASRAPSVADSSTVRFDWEDHDSFQAPFNHAEGPVAAVYIVLPPRSNPDNDIFSFVKLAVEKGVRRFVLLSAAVCQPGPDASSPHGRIHNFFLNLQAENPSLKVSVLRPSFFMENFSEQQHLATIRDEGAFYSATGMGGEAFVSCEDIASVAAKCLLGEGDRTEYWIVGPQAVNHDEIASILSKVTGKSILHRKLSSIEFIERARHLGMPEEYAQMMGGIDAQIAKGLGTQPNDVVIQVLGRAPITFEEYAKMNRSAWV